MAIAAKNHERSRTYSSFEERDDDPSGKEDNSVKSGESKTSMVTQDFHRLMESFSNEIKLAVPCDGIKYRSENVDQHFVTGVLDNYLCCFEIKVGEQSFGNIYFARETQFMDSELTILENMVAGLVLPLCNLFQKEITLETSCDKDADDNPAATSSTACHQPV